MDFDKDLNIVLLEIEKMYLEIGTAYTEAVYQNAVKMIFQKYGFSISSEMPVIYSWECMEIGAGRYDIVASKNEQRIIIELKATVSKKCKWSEIRQMKNYMVQNDFKHGIIINFPQIEKHQTGIYFYCLLNCQWTPIKKTIKTSLGEHKCALKSNTGVDEIIKDDTQSQDQLMKLKIDFLYP